MSDLNLLEVTVTPAKGSMLSKTLQEACGAICGGIKKDGGDVYHAFEFAGENKFVLVTDGRLCGGADALHQQFGDSVSVTVSPLTAYEDFAVLTLGLDRSEVASCNTPMSEGGNILYCSFVVHNQAADLNDLLGRWAHEAKGAMKQVQEGGPDGPKFYKVAGENKVLAFMKVTPPQLDAVFFKMPMTTGNQANFQCVNTTKRVHVMKC